MSNKIKYDIVIETQGKPEIVEATDKMRDQHQVHEDLSNSLGKVVELDAELHDRQRASTAAMDTKRTAARQVVQETERLSTAEQRLEQTIQEVNHVLEENSYDLEAARLEYETGGLTLEEYTARLHELQVQIANQDAPSSKLIRRQREINREIRNLNPELATTRTNMSSANSAMFAGASALARINPQLGSTAMSALSVSRSLGQVTTTSGGLTQALRQMASFAMSPMGIVAVLGSTATAAALLYSRFTELRENTVDLEEAGKSYSVSLDDMIKKLQELRDVEQGFFGTGNSQERLSWQKQLIEEVDSELESLREAHRLNSQLYTQVRQTREEKDKQRERAARINELEATRTDALEKVSELEQEIHNRRQLQRFQAGRDAKEQTELQEDQNRREQHQLELRELKLDLLRKEIEIMEGMEPAVLDDELDDSMFKDVYDDLQNEAAAYFDFEGKLQAMRIERHRSTLDAMEQLEYDKQLRLREVEENELIAEWQRQEARFLIEQEFAYKKQELLDHELEQRIQAENQITQLINDHNQQRVQLGMMAAQALSVINENIIGGSRLLTFASFALEKALAIGNVILTTQQKAAEASMTAWALLANPTTAPLALNAFAMVAKIKSTGYATAAIMGAMSIAEGAAGAMGGGGSGGGGSVGSGSASNPMAGYRGISAPTTSGGNEGSSGGNNSPGGNSSDDGRGRNRESGYNIVLPDTLKITDRLGRLLTRMEYDRDASGDKPYLIPKND